jgi:diguanylate cyclase (GGDEF)-like protein/PAS domain S-box-containing protein
MNLEPTVNIPPLQLHEFLRSESDAILREWERVDRQTLSPAKQLSSATLRNNIPSVLDAIIEQAENATCVTAISPPEMDGPKLHAEQRWHLGFSLEEVTREYGLLRTVILQKLVLHIGELPSEELVLLNEALDNAIIDGVTTYVTKSNRNLEDERERLQVTLRSIADGVIGTDLEGNIAYMNPAAEQMTGWPREKAMGQPVSDVLIAIDETTRHPLKSLVQIATETDELSQHPSEILLRRSNGELLPAEEVAAPLRDATGKFLGVVTTFRDVSNIRALTSQLGYLAAHDPLTDLPNRTLLLDRLRQEFAHAERNKGRLALLYLDLDLFKEVNDVFGHSAGDELLKQVARRLQTCVRRTDTVCRVGGDEFVILLTEFEQLTYLSELSTNIATQIRAPYAIGADKVEISISVGISIFPEDGRDPETLIKHADVAMFQAKAHGRNSIQFFAPEMNKRAIERRKLLGSLRQAIAANQLSLNFQPQMSLHSGQVIGAEALLRWYHPRLGAISPSRFIPVAEDSRETMIAIGNWVLEQACRQLRIWLDAGHPPLRISVNVSIVQLRDESLLDHLSEVLQRFQLPADLLQLELTESTLMSDIEGAVHRIEALEALGVRISVDDFGTGYSSLSYLKDLPVDELKIDQSFMHDVSSNEGKAGIVQAIILMGKSLNLRVIAEGVEDKETVEFLTTNGCEGAQGYYYSSAIAPAGFEQQFLSRH